jgi:hypothetical protein
MWVKKSALKDAPFYVSYLLVPEDWVLEEYMPHKHLVLRKT